MASSLGNNPNLPLTEAVRIAASDAILGQFANLPTAFKSAGKELRTKDEYVRKLDGLKQYPIKQLQEAAQILGQLNRFNIKADKRLSLSLAIVGQIYSVLNKFYQQYQSSLSSLPENPDRRQIVIAGIEIAEQAAIACKHMFRELYSAKTAGYQRNRDKLLELAIRILEFLRIEQRLRGLRHQKLPVSAWQDTNRTFFSLLVHDDVDTKLPLLGNLGTWGKIDKTNRESFKSSVRGLYFSIQMFGLLDTPSWSTRLFHVPDGYMDMLDNAILLQLDHQQELVPGFLQIGIDHGGPAVFQRDIRMQAPCLLLEYSQLYNRLIQDYEELAKMKFIGNVDASRLNKPLLSLEPMERLPFLESMLFGLRPRERRQKRHAAFGSEMLRLYFGYREAFRLLVDLASPDIKYITQSRAFVDTLASHSSGITESNGMEQTKWEIANFSTGGLLVVTRETTYTTPIRIGQIAAFISGKEMKRPLVGYVTRIHRPNEQNIEVAIVRLSNHAEAALVTCDTGKLAGQRLGVILFQSPDSRWCLIARHEYDFVSGTPLRLARDRDTAIPARLGNVLLTKQEFVVFELSAPGM